MGPDGTPQRPKRSRAVTVTDHAAPAATSSKRRKLTQTSPSSPTTPKRSAAKSVSKLKSRTNGTGDVGGENPVSDSEERSKPRSRTANGAAQLPAATAPPYGEADPYDIPPSEDEISVHTPTARGRKAISEGSGRTKQANKSTQNHNARVSGRRVQKSGDEIDEDDLAGENHETSDSGSDSGAADESPLKRRSSGRRRTLTTKAQDMIVVSTPTANRRKEKVGGGAGTAVPLKGILTPSRRDRQTPRKSVTFEDAEGRRGTPLVFKDIPKPEKQTKKTQGGKELSQDTGKVTKPQPTQQPKLAQRQESTDVGAGAEENGDEEEEEEEDDEVCAICSKPNSRPPNEILFCDGCDMAVHQKCYGVPKIPEGDWFCKECVQRKDAKAAEGANVPNFERHLRSLQRVLLDRCTGRRRIKLIGHEEPYETVHQLLQQTVLAGEGNSLLVIGGRGCGKTTLVERSIGELSANHRHEFHVVRLNGFIQTDDKLALKEIWRQLGKEMDVEDETTTRSNYADTMASLLALLSHPSEISQTEEGVTSRAVVFVIDEFDMFALHPRQTLLYNLFDIAQARKAPIAVVGCTTRLNVVEMLEKRVKSRFSHRHVFLPPPRSYAAYWQICKQGLTVDEEDMEEVGIDVSVEGHDQFHENWNQMIKDLYNERSFQALLKYHYYTSKSASAFWSDCILPLTRLSPNALELEIPPAPGTAVRLAPPSSKLHLLGSLSELDLALLIAAARLDIVAHTDTVNLAMAYEEYASLMGRQRVQSASSGMMALGGGVRVWGRGVAAVAWERLIALGLLLPAGIGGGRLLGGGTRGGLDGRMWKVAVALEEIPVAVKLSQVLTRWCKEV